MGWATGWWIIDGVANGVVDGVVDVVEEGQSGKRT